MNPQKLARFSGLHRHMAKAKRKPKKPIEALWLLEHADGPDEYVVAADGVPGCPDCYVAMTSLKTAKAQAKHQQQLCDILCVPVKFDVTPAAGTKP